VFNLREDSAARGHVHHFARNEMQHEIRPSRVHRRHRTERKSRATRRQIPWSGAIGVDNKFARSRSRSPIRDRFRARDVCRPAFTPFGNKVARIPERLSRRAIATGRVSNRHRCAGAVISRLQPAAGAAASPERGPETFRCAL